jgi:hypothetical protein
MSSLPGMTDKREMVMHSERTLIKSLYVNAARWNRFGFSMLRLGLVVVLCWSGGLKAAP